MMGERHDRFVACRPPGSGPGHCGGRGGLWAPHGIRRAQLLAARDPSASAEERNALQREIPLLRRAVLAVDIIVLAGLGYWLGQMIGG